MEGALVRSTLFVLLLIFIFTVNLTAQPATAAAVHHSGDFIRISCRSTRYPAICEQCLTAYAPSIRRSPRQLAHAALTVSAARARSASTFVSRLSATSKSLNSKNGGAVHDCLQTLSDSVDRLSRSAKEMNRMGRFGTSRFNWHLSNVQTWVSAALTDQSTCLDSLAQDSKTVGVRAQIRVKINDVAQVTSNALALVNRLQG